MTPCGRWRSRSPCRARVLGHGSVRIPPLRSPIRSGFVGRSVEDRELAVGLESNSLLRVIECCHGQSDRCTSRVLDGVRARMRVELVRCSYEIAVGRISAAKSSRCSRNWSGRSPPGENWTSMKTSSISMSAQRSMSAMTWVRDP